MAADKATQDLLQNKYVRILSAVLLAQAALFYATSRGENVPEMRPLKDFPKEVSDWRMVKEGYVDAETQEVLKADDTLTRTYASPRSPLPPNLFVAFFKSQRTGKAPHSPKNCLPGAGWEQSRSDSLYVTVPSLAQPIEVNRYVVARGEDKSVVLYWYQSQKRVVASEYKAKIWTVADAIRYNRTDTALVRVVVPVQQNDEAAAEKVAVEFVQAFFGTLRQHLPS
jgi:EpsI family protein